MPGRLMVLSQDQLGFLYKKMEELGPTGVAEKLGAISSGFTTGMIARGSIATCKMPRLRAWMSEKSCDEATPTIQATLQPPKSAIGVTMANAIWAKLSDHDKTEAIMNYLSKAL